MNAKNRSEGRATVEAVVFPSKFLRWGGGVVITLSNGEQFMHKTLPSCPEEYDSMRVEEFLRQHGVSVKARKGVKARIIAKIEKRRNPARFFNTAGA